MPSKLTIDPICSKCSTKFNKQAEEGINIEIDDIIDDFEILWEIVEPKNENEVERILDLLTTPGSPFFQANPHCRCPKCNRIFGREENQEKYEKLRTLRQKKSLEPGEYTVQVYRPRFRHNWQSLFRKSCLTRFSMAPLSCIFDSMGWCKKNSDKIMAVVVNLGSVGLFIVLIAVL